MLNPYPDNPYRVLGLTVDAGGPTCQRLEDLPPALPVPGLPPPPRNPKAVEQAWSKVTDARTHRRYNFSWFTLDNADDRSALNLISQSEFEKALELLKEASHTSSVQNRAVLSHLMALTRTTEDSDFWELWGVCLRSWSILASNFSQDIYLVETRETIIEDMVDLAQDYLQKGLPEVCAMVMKLFYESELGTNRLLILDKQFLGDEFDRLRYRCAKVREGLVSLMRERPEGVGRQISLMEREMNSEILPTIDWIQRAAHPLSTFLAKSKEEVCLLYRTLARAWGSLADDQHRQERALEAAVRFAPPDLKAELELEIESLHDRASPPKIATPLPQPPPREEEADLQKSPPPSQYSFLGTGLELVLSPAYEKKDQERTLAEAVYFLKILTLNIFPVARYQARMVAPGEIESVSPLPMTEGLLIQRVLVMVLVALGILVLVRGALVPQGGVELELERAALRAKVDWLVTRASQIAEKAAKALEEKDALEIEMADIRSQLEVKPDNAKFKKRLEELEVKKKKAEITFRNLDRERTTLLRRATRLNEALESFR